MNISFIYLIVFVVSFWNVFFWFTHWPNYLGVMLKEKELIGIRLKWNSQKICKLSFQFNFSHLFLLSSSHDIISLSHWLIQRREEILSLHQYFSFLFLDSNIWNLKKNKIKWAVYLMPLNQLINWTCWTFVVIIKSQNFWLNC